MYVLNILAYTIMRAGGQSCGRAPAIELAPAPALLVAGARQHAVTGRPQLLLIS